MGGSASAVLAGPTIAVATELFGDENVPDLKDLSGLGLVNFEIVTHCDMPLFEKAEAYAKKSPNPVYALDDLSAILVVDGESTVISKGSWKLYDK